MKLIDLLPSMLNWTLVIFAILFSGNWISFLLVSLPIICLEIWRVWRIRKEFGMDLTPVLIRQYYEKDHAFKWLSVKNQIEGLRKVIYTQENDDVQQKYSTEPPSSVRSA